MTPQDKLNLHSRENRKYHEYISLQFLLSCSSWNWDVVHYFKLKCLRCWITQLHNYTITQSQNETLWFKYQNKIFSSRLNLTPWYAKLNQSGRLKNLDRYATAPQFMFIFSPIKLIMHLNKLRSLSSNISWLSGPYKWSLF